MPKTLTMLSGFLVASLILTGLISARDVVEQTNLQYPLSDAQVVITPFTNIESICEPTVVRYILNNTSTVGGGPVPMVGAQLEARFPKLNWFGIEANHITVDKGNVTIGEDGNDYVITNLIGNVDPNDIYNMDIQLNNQHFFRFADFMGEVRSNTFDPNPNNNSAAILPEFSFLPPQSFTFGGLDNITEIPPDFDPTTKLPQFQVVDPMQPFAFELSMLFDDEKCANLPADRQFSFQDGSLVTWFVGLADKVENFEVVDPSSPVEITTDGNDLKATFNLGNYSYGDELKFGLNIKLNSDYSGTFEYSTEFTAENIDDDVDIFSNSGTFTVPERTYPDLKIWKFASLPDSSRIPMLDTLRYTLKIANIGDADAVNVTVKDTIPNPQLGLHSVNSNMDNCTISGNVVNCSKDKLSPGDTMTVNIVTVANFPGSAINKAYVSTSSEELNLENNKSNQVVHFPETAERRADLQIEIISMLPDSIRRPDVLFVYALVKNNGTNDAQNASVTFQFSEPVTIDFMGYAPDATVSCQNNNPNQATNTINCTISALPVRHLASFSFFARTGSAGANVIGVNGSVTPGTPQDPNLDNNEHQLSHPVIGTPPLRGFPQPPVGAPTPNPNQIWADLELRKSVLWPAFNPFAPPFLVGSNIFYRYSIKNNGKDPAVGVVFEDFIIGHPGIKNYDLTSLPVALQPNCSLIPALFFDVLKCDLGTMQPGAVENFGIKAVAVDSIGFPLPNIASVSSKTPDPNMLNNTETNVVSIYRLPLQPILSVDLSIEYLQPVTTKPASGDSVHTVIASISNLGSATAPFAVYNDTLPPALRLRELQYNGAQEDHPFCVADVLTVDGMPRDRVKCLWSRIEPGEGVSVTMEVAVRSMGHLNLYGYAKSAAFEIDFSNNVDSLKLTNPLGTSTDDGLPDVPTETTLFQNFPNPFNPTTQLSFQLKANSHVVLELYTVDGRKILRLIEGVYIAGRHSMTLDASNLGSGVYLYRLLTDHGSYVQKLTVVK